MKRIPAYVDIKAKYFLKKILLKFFYGKYAYPLVYQASVGDLFVILLFQKIFRINSHVPFPVHYTNQMTRSCRRQLLAEGDSIYNFALSGGLYIQATNGIKIGAGTIIAPGVKIISANHDQYDFHNTYIEGNPVVIGRHCWIGANVVILPGVVLGDNCVVAAGAVVHRSFDTGSIVGGVPAVLIKKKEPQPREYRMCNRCILDTNDDPEITFNTEGVCNHCMQYTSLAAKYNYKNGEGERKLDEIVQTIKKQGKGKPYDCIMGLSGGVDSTYLAYHVKRLGLRPLVVHFDNGWNSEIAVNNIENILKKLGFDLYTYVVDWKEFRDLQLSYIKASVIDWEIPSDHGFFAILFHLAARHNIRHILSGHNIATEAILPKYMRWSKMDVANILDIHRKYGTMKLKTFPMLGFFRYAYYLLVKKIELVNILNYLPYNRKEIKELIHRELEWKDYGGKHYESIFTRFYQGYVLPEKFGVDKRKAHLSNMIMSGQISREEALSEIQKPPYDPAQLKIDMEYVIKKLGLTPQEFRKYMEQPAKSHLDYVSYETGLYRRHERFFSLINPLIRAIRKISGRKG